MLVFAYSSSSCQGRDCSRLQRQPNQPLNQISISAKVIFPSAAATTADGAHDVTTTILHTYSSTPISPYKDKPFASRISRSLPPPGLQIPYPLKTRPIQAQYQCTRSWDELKRHQNPVGVNPRDYNLPLNRTTFYVITSSSNSPVGVSDKGADKIAEKRETA